jgi:hypothetical protein
MAKEGLKLMRRRIGITSGEKEKESIYLPDHYVSVHFIRPELADEICSYPFSPVHILELIETGQYFVEVEANAWELAEKREKK